MASASSNAPNVNQSPIEQIAQVLLAHGLAIRVEGGLVPPTASITDVLNNTVQRVDAIDSMDVGGKLGTINQAFGQAETELVGIRSEIDRVKLVAENLKSFSETNKGHVEDMVVEIKKQQSVVEELVKNA